MLCNPLFIPILPFKFYLQLEASQRRRGEPLTLSAHRTKTFGRILLNPGHETMLMPYVLRPRSAVKLVGISYHVKRMCTFANYCQDQQASKILVIQHPRSGQSSPGYLHVGQVPSNCTRQIPHTSSSGMSHLHVATACHFFILTFMAHAKGEAALHLLVKCGVKNSVPHRILQVASRRYDFEIQCCIFGAHM